MTAKSQTPGVQRRMRYSPCSQGDHSLNLSTLQGEVNSPGRHDMLWAEGVGSHGWKLGKLLEEGGMRGLKQPPNSAHASVYLSDPSSPLPNQVCLFT